MMRRLAAMPLVVLLAIGASLAVAQVQSGKGWIDQPLGWKVITEVPVKVTAHVTHPGGVTEARLMVNGEEIGQVPLGGETLEMVEFSWEPPGSGQYLVEVFGFGGNEWGVPGTVEVTVSLEEEPVDTTTTTEGTTTTVGGSTTTTTSTSSTTSTTSSSTTTTSSTTTSTTSTTTTSSTTTTTVCSYGVPAPTGPTGTLASTFATLTWSYTGCLEPMEFMIQLSQRSGFEGASGDFVPGDARQLSVGPLACGDWYWRIKSYLPEEGAWSFVGSFRVDVRSCP